MTDLADFLRGRIGEEERLAHLARDTEPALWADIEKGGIPDLDATMATVAMMNRWSPRLVLAECEAKRRIIELHDHPDGSCWEMHRGVYGPGWPEGSYAVEGQLWAHPSLEPPEVHPGPCETLQLLALPYADHPDYRAQWRP